MSNISTSTLNRPLTNFTGPDISHPFPQMENGKEEQRRKESDQASGKNTLEISQNVSLPLTKIDQLQKNKIKKTSGGGADEKATTICDEYPYTCEGCDPQAMRKVVAVSLYGNDKRYYEQLPSIAENVEGLFGRDWVLRVYTDSPANVSSLLKGVQIVDMGNLGCQRPPNPMCWRFLPALDATVDVFLSRDTDNVLIHRDRDAVMEWLHNTSYECNVMRDHPAHTVPIMGGMWGFRGQPSMALRQHFQKAIYSSQTKKGDDQIVLARYVFPHVSCLAHDAFHCGNMKDAEWRPFPTRRDSELRAVGVPKGSHVPASCPAKCRKNINWTQC